MVVLVLIKHQTGRLVRPRVVPEFKPELFQILAVMMLLTSHRSVLHQMDFMELGLLGLHARQHVDKVYSNVDGIIIAARHLMFKKDLAPFLQVLGQPGRSGQTAPSRVVEQMSYVKDSTRVLVKLTQTPSFVTRILVPTTVPGLTGPLAQHLVVWAQ